MHIPGRLIGLLLLAMLEAPGQTPGPPLPAEARQFDFWLGEWEVTNPAGKLVGKSRIESIAGGAGLLENWTSANGYTGRSLNAWNAAGKKWQQFWVGSDGGVLELSGTIENGRMVLAGESKGNGVRRLERITWTPLGDGTVRQHWEQSGDGGKTWTTSFDGLYRRRI